VRTGKLHTPISNKLIICDISGMGELFGFIQPRSPPISLVWTSLEWSATRRLNVYKEEAESFNVNANR
jgi:hypothetical protein